MMPTKTTHKKFRALSGCLQKGDHANGYKLTTANAAPGKSRATRSNWENMLDTQFQGGWNARALNRAKEYTQTNLQIAGSARFFPQPAGLARRHMPVWNRGKFLFLLIPFLE